MATWIGRQPEPVSIKRSEPTIAHRTNCSLALFERRAKADSTGDGEIPPFSKSHRLRCKKLRVPLAVGVGVPESVLALTKARSIILEIGTKDFAMTDSLP